MSKSRSEVGLYFSSIPRWLIDKVFTRRWEDISGNNSLPSVDSTGQQVVPHHSDPDPQMSRPSVRQGTLLLVGRGWCWWASSTSRRRSQVPGAGQGASVLVRRHSIRGANGLRAPRTPIRHLGGPGGANHLSHLWNTSSHPISFFLGLFLHRHIF